MKVMCAQVVININNNLSTTFMKIKIFLAITILFPIMVWGAETYQAKVVGVIDGDTIKVLRPGDELIKIRFAGIDCPERKQPWGTKAKQATSDFVMDKNVLIESMSVDRYGRTIGRVFVNGMNINRELVGSGHCWTYVKYAKDSQLSILEEKAKAANLGLWQLPESERIPPWEWRRNKNR